VLESQPVCSTPLLAPCRSPLRLISRRSPSQSVYLAARVAGRLAADAEGGSRCGQENGVFNEELWLPSHGRYASSGAVSRVMNYLCFPNSKVKNNNNALHPSPPLGERPHERHLVASELRSKTPLRASPLHCDWLDG
jgi:hypothetical protein